MGLVRPLAGIVLCSCFSLCLSAQQPAPSEPTQGAAPPTVGRRVPMVQTPPPLAKANDQGAALLQRCLTAVGAQANIADVTLTGNITVLMPGGTSNTGPITMAARGDSQAQITMQTASGTHIEVRSVSSEGVPAQMRSNPDGTVTHSPVHSLFTPHPAWFFPQFVLTAQPQSNTSSSFIAAETRSGLAVNHIEVWQLPSTSSTPPVPAPLLQHETQYDLYLDAGTSLPVAMVYWVQPDYSKAPAIMNAHRDTRAPVEMRFSDYRVVQGTPVAYHIQAFIQGRQIYDIQLSSASLNTGAALPSVN